LELQIPGLENNVARGDVDTGSLGVAAIAYKKAFLGAVQELGAGFPGLHRNVNENLDAKWMRVSFHAAAHMGCAGEGQQREERCSL
jgi:hypothetical protein